MLTRADGGEVVLGIPLGIGSGLISDEIELLLEHSNPFWGSERLAALQVAGSAAAVAAIAIRVGLAAADRRSR